LLAHREEEARVKAEVERIEKWKKEFIDMDDVVSGVCVNSIVTS
jgi:hypothetical protein